jgi:hypothetical protein
MHCAPTDASECAGRVILAPVEATVDQRKRTGYDRKHDTAGKCRLIHQGTSISTLQVTDPKAACRESFLDHNLCCANHPVFALLARGEYHLPFAQFLYHLDRCLLARMPGNGHAFVNT